MKQNLEREVSEPAMDISNALTENPDFERMWVKLPGRKITDVTKWSTPVAVGQDEGKVREYFGRRKGKRLNIHNHPRQENGYVKGHACPSSNDMLWFLEEPHTTMVIAQTGDKGKVEGYTFIRKTESFRKSKLPKIRKDLRQFCLCYAQAQEKGNRTKGDIYNVFEEQREQMDEGRISAQNWLGQIKEFASDYGLQTRFVPAKGYSLGRNKLCFRKNRSQN